MTLPSSGPLTLADIQTEFGGSNPISLSEYYAGGAYVPAGTTGTYGAVPSSGAISISNFYGTSAILDTQTVTVGSYITKYAYAWGYSSDYGVGSIVDGTFNPKGGAAITTLWHSSDIVYFYLNGSQTNAGWTTMTIDGTAFTRASASYFDGGSYTYWAWVSIPNPFGTTSGATKTVVFT